MNELYKQVSVRKVKEYFDLEQVCGDDSSLERWTIAPDINRPGLELSGYRETGELRRIVVIGQKEGRYISTLDYDTQCDRFGFLTDAYTPCIIVTAKQEVPRALLDVANKKNFPVFKFPGDTYELTTDLISFLSNRLAPSKTIYGELMNIYGVGVLITGASGIGKSELCLDLIKRGHIFVADDLVEIYKANNTIYGTAPDNIKQMLEIRGIGIVDVGLTFGAHCYINKYRINFVINLVKFDDYTKNNPDRLNPTEKYIDLMGVQKKIVEIPVTEGKNMPAIIETAVAKYIQNKNGIDTTEIFKKRIKDEITRKDRGEL